MVDGNAPGQPSKLNDDQRQALARMVESGPIPALHGVVRWRLKDLAWWVYEEFRKSAWTRRRLAASCAGSAFRKLSARPRHYAQNKAALEDFKQLSRPDWTRSRRSCRPASV